MALDLSSRCGFAYGVTGGNLPPPTTGMWRLPSIDDEATVGKAFSRLRQHLCDLHAIEKFDVLIYEAALDTYAHTSSARKSSTLARALIGLSCIAEEWGETNGLEVLDANVSSVRSFFVGDGRAKKDIVMHRCRQLGWDFKEDNNAADACAVWAFECAARDPAWAVALAGSIKGNWNI